MGTTGTDLMLRRRRAGVSTIDVGRQLGITRQAVTKIEMRGDVEVAPETAERIIAAIDNSKADVRRYLACGMSYAEATGAAREWARKTGAHVVHVVAAAGGRWESVLGSLDGFAAEGVLAVLYCEDARIDRVKGRKRRGA